MILTILNSKGGVAKTTTAVNLAAALALAGYRTLLLDLDQQRSASLSLGIPRNEHPPSSASILLEGLPASRAIRSTSTPGLDLIPAAFSLAHADIALADVRGRESRLRSALEPLRTEYDFILIDCPPSLSLLPINALLASDYYVVPLTPDYFAVEGLTSLFEAITMIQTGIGKVAELLGVALTIVDYRPQTTRGIVDMIRDAYGNTIFITEIPINAPLSRAPGFGFTIFQHEPASPGAKAYRNLAAEIVDRTNKSK